MADIRAFRGFRYDLGKIGSLANAVAPPYDVVDAKLQQTLYDLSPFNAIRVELTKDEPGDDETNNRYTRAGQTADQLIERAAHRFQSYGEVLVVTDDFAERDTVSAAGGMISSCENFIRTVNSALADLEHAIRNYNQRERSKFHGSR